MASDPEPPEQAMRRSPGCMGGRPGVGVLGPLDGCGLEEEEVLVLLVLGSELMARLIFLANRR